MMKKHEFTNGELTEKAMEVYTNSSFTFWEDGATFYYSDNPKSEKVELGDLDDVNEFLEEFFGKVLNSYGVLIDFNAAMQLTDDDLREEIHRELAPCSEQEFFDEYAKRHEEKFGEVWELAKENPQY